LTAQHSWRSGPTTCAGPHSAAASGPCRPDDRGGLVRRRLVVQSVAATYLSTQNTAVIVVLGAPVWLLDRPNLPAPPSRLAVRKGSARPTPTAPARIAAAPRPAPTRPGASSRPSTWSAGCGLGPPRADRRRQQPGAPVAPAGPRLGRSGHLGEPLQSWPPGQHLGCIAARAPGSACPRRGTSATSSRAWR
jgi:hypothetical protein